MEKKNKKVVVVGGAGFVGSHIVDALVGKGYIVDVIDNLIAGKKEHVNDKARLHVLDIRVYDDIASIISGADYVFHLAALPRVQFSIDEPIQSNDVNITGMLNVLVAAQKGGVKRVIYSASSSAYGDQEALPLSETVPAKPLSPYALQKYVGELYCELFSKVYGLSTVSLRYFNVYGPRQDPEGPYALVIGKFLKQKKEGVPLTITGDGTQTRDFTHVTDIVRANLLAMESERVGKGDVVNIGSGHRCTINNLARLIGGEIKYIPPRIEPKHTEADVTRAKELLGWEPRMSLEEGIKDLIEKEHER